jgi:hypothetical protein
MSKSACNQLQSQAALTWRDPSRRAATDPSVADAAAA